ncbi:MAG: hypothetical protein ACYTGV_05740, partial [Planctomycetota bacterium]
MLVVAGPAGRLFLLLLALGGVLSAAALDGLTFDHKTRSLLRSDPDAEARSEELAKVFGSEDLLLVAWEVASATDAEEFERLGRVTTALDSLEGLEEIYSIASPRVPLRIGDQLRPVSVEDLRSETGRAAVRDGLLASPVYLGTIYSANLDVVAVA